MIKGYQQKITELYEKIQEDEKKALRRRKEEIKLTVPEVMELDNEIQRFSLSSRQKSLSYHLSLYQCQFYVEFPRKSLMLFVKK